MINNKKPSRQEMIDEIYEKIARKDLSFGCKMKSQSYNGVLISIEGGDNAKIMDVDYYDSISFEDINDFEIIGHPVMIGDVMNYLEIFSKNKIIDVGYLIKHWMIKTMPIEEQSSDCIEYVYNLIK